MASYAADLQRLVELADHKITSDSDPMVVEQFLTGLPPSFACQVRMSLIGQTASLSNCIERVRILRLAERDSAASKPRNVAAATGMAPRRSSGRSSGKSVLCYNCEEVGHVKKNCPKLRKRTLKCFICDEPGHIRGDCPEWREFQRSRSAKGKVAAVNSESSSTHKCLYTTPVDSSPSAMPFVFVDICADERWQRVKGAIDTGSTRTLVTLSAVQSCDAAAQINRNAQCDLVALDGTPIHVLGEICLELKRDDGPGIKAVVSPHFILFLFGS